MKGLFLSFCKFKTTSKWTWVGFDNYVSAFNDPSFLHAFWYTAIFAVTSLILINVLSFAVAYALTRGIRGTNIFRTVFFMPNLIGGIVLGYIWAMIFDGVLSRYGTSILLKSQYGYWGLQILMAWQQIGYMMIIYIAGLQAVPEDILEAARIDGANAWQKFKNITLPAISPTMFFLLVTGIINVLQEFARSQVWNSSGGPNGKGITIVFYLYREAFDYNNMGHASAVAWILSIMIVIVTIINFVVSKKWVKYD